MAQIFQAPLAREFSNTGSIGSGYKYYFYTTGTTTPISTYTTPALSVANAYPVVADSTGRFPPIWVSNLATTKVILKDASDNVIYTQDPVGTTSTIASLNDLDIRPNSYWGLTTGTTSAYVLTANPSISAYSNVQSFTFQAHIANIINPTIAISGLGALNLKKYTGQGTKVSLQAGDLQPTQRYEAFCDGVDIVVLNPRSLPLNTGTAPTLTIAAGVIAVTNVGSSYLIDTEGASAIDDLDTINGGGDGDVIFVRNVNNARNVVLKHATGNIWNPQNLGASNRDITLDTTSDFAFLRYDSTIAYWVVIASSVNMFLNSQNVNGYTYLPNGLIMQWGEEAAYHDVAGDYTANVTFAITFPNTCLQVLAGLKGNGNPADNNDISGLHVTAQSVSGFTIAMGEVTTQINSVKGNWIAFGN
jgi:hypothetical protein